MDQLSLPRAVERNLRTLLLIRVQVLYRDFLSFEEKKQTLSALSATCRIAPTLAKTTRLAR